MCCKGDIHIFLISHQYNTLLVVLVVLANVINEQEKKIMKKKELGRKGLIGL